MIIHQGLYREWVDIPSRGSDEYHRLILRAAEGEHVVISGAELLRDWQCIGGDLWQCDVPDDWFTGTNTLRRELGGDWFWHKHQPQHLGELFIDQQPLIECCDPSGC